MHLSYAQLESGITVQSTVLPCGYTVIPFITNGMYNRELSAHHGELSCLTLKLLKEESSTDRLADNYDKWLKLETMALYSVLWDDVNNKPVMTTGAQITSKNTCRLFSRYYLFDDCRTSASTTNMFDKVDNFEVDLYHMNILKDKYPFFFWSRDKGTNFFKRIKQVRNDIFENWTVYDSPIELLFENNYQGIIYTGDSNYINELTFNK